MSNGRSPFGADESGAEEVFNLFKSQLPSSAQEWIDRATSQGEPPDYEPPMPPGSGQRGGSGGAPAPGGPHQPPPPPRESGRPTPSGPNVIDTSSGKADGLDKCPRCGSTEVSLRPGTGKLVCHFCRFEWQESTLEQSFGFDSPIAELRGVVIGSGASNVPESTHDVVTLKCGACGAEVVVNAAESVQARCHWCRNTLSLNQQLPNAAVPDGLLPFTVTRDDAIARIDNFVKQRKFFAHPKFVREFAPSEVVGVYLPYLTMDANAHVQLEGTGEVLTRQYSVKRGDNTITLFDADVYRLGRSFDVRVDDILLESSGQRADQDTSRNTNNIINAILPFDVKEAVTYNANYLRGFTSERRDLHIEGVQTTADERVLSVARARAGEMTRQYDRGVRWEREALEVRGTRWLALYVPVWLYSYYEVRGGRGLVHYVAVNGRNGTTMGSVPVRQGRLFGVSLAIGVVGTVIGGALAFLMM